MRLLTALLVIAATAGGQNQKSDTITLDAAEKKIVRTAYHDDEAVTISGSDAAGWRLYAGAAIDAQRIDLTMRNVRGTVRFHADWSRLADMLERSKRRQRIESLK